MDIKAFGLTVDNTGAVKAIRDVSKSAADMARDGAKSAQLYADAFRERLNQVAYKYIPETMRAIDALREKQRSLTQAPTGGIPGVLSAQEIQRSAAAFDRMIEAQKGVAAASGPATTGMNRLRSAVTTMAQSALSSAPGVLQFGSVLGSLALGSALTIGVMAGLAAIGYAWDELTKKSREATKAQDDAIKKFEEMQRKRANGAGGDTVELVAKMRERVAQDRATIASLQATPVDAFARGKGITDPAAAAVLATRAAEIDRLQKNIEAGERDIAEAVAKAGGALVERQVSDLAALIAAHKATAQEIQNAKQLVQGFTASLNALSGDGSKNAERAKLIAQIRELNDALNPKKETRDAAREAKEAQDLADKQANARNQLAIDAIRRQQAERTRLNKEADEAAKKSAAELAAEEQRRIHEVERIARSSFASLFTDILTNGKGAFQSLFDAIKAGFIKLAADLVAVNIVGRLAKAGILATLFPAAAGAQGGTNELAGLGRYIAGQAAGGAAFGGLVGFGIGGMVQGRAGGGVAGAAAGALAGSAFGPIGAATGALTGFVAGILGAGRAASEAAERLKSLRESLSLTFDEIRATISGDDTALAVARLKKDFVELRKAIDEAFPESHLVQNYRAMGGMNLDLIKQLMELDAAANAVRAGKLAELNDLEQQRIKQIMEEGKAAKEATRAGLNLVQGYKLQAAVFNAMAGQSGPSGGSGGGQIAVPRGRTESVSDATPLVVQLDGGVLFKSTVGQLRKRAAASGISRGEAYKAFAT